MGSVTEEQAMYAKGLEEALEHLRQSEPPGSNDLRLQTPLPPLVQLPWDQLAEPWRCIELCPSHIEALTCTRAYQRRNRTKGFPSLCKPLPILDLLQGRRGLTTLRPTKCRMESRLRTSLMIISVCLEVITGQRG